MSKSKNCDFCGWATRNNVQCSDGRTIMQDAFQNDNGKIVPLVWNHQHNDPNNVLGHAELENRKEGVYVYGTFNDTESGKTAKMLVQHGDISALSIYANQLKQRNGCVMHGTIREVSLVHAGANPEAFIEDIIQHGEISEEEAYIFTGTDIILDHLEHSDDKKENSTEDSEEETVEDVFNTLTEKQKTVVYALIGQALEESEVSHADADNPQDEDNDEETVEDVFNTLTEKQKTVVYALIGQAIEDNENNDNKGGNAEMKHNVFEGDNAVDTNVISHADQEAILTTAKQSNCGSFRAALNMYLEENSDALAHGFETIEALFPDVQDLKPGAPEAIPENDAWVRTWMSKVHKSPFSRVRTRQADISKVRASGYKTKGAKKTNTGNVTLVSRTTDPQTVYIHDELNRDDINDITDFDIVSYEHNILRGALDAELARAALFGDGREPGDAQKIAEDHIRPVWTDDDMYTIHKIIDIDAMKTTLQGTNTAANFGDEYIYAEAVITAFRHAMEEYKGSGSVDCYCSTHLLNTMLLARDMNGRRIYDTEADLAKALHVHEIVECDEISGLTRTSTAEADRGSKYELQALFVNANDYNYGATKGGKTSQFSDFDIDFNRYKYLIETRLSGALTRVKSAIALETKVASAGV